MRNPCFTPAHVGWLASLALLAMIAMTTPATAATAAEMLEKGIYTEETVGDLDGAIEVYLKVVVEGKESAKAAAQAQFRIGMCYQKQGKADLAARAFQSVIDGYPAATDWVNKAKSQLATDTELLPVPWGEGDEMQLEMKLQTGLGIGVQVWRVAKSQHEGKPAWECNAWQVVTANSQKGKSQVFADANTFAPLASTWKHSLLGEATAAYTANDVEIKLASKTDPTTLTLDSKIYDNEQAAEMFRRLPLKPGYKTDVTVVSTLVASKVPIELEVTGTETITVPAGTFECFRMELNIGQTFYISNDPHRYIVRFEAGGVTADLTRVGPSQAGKPTSFDSDRLSTTLPPDWFAYTPSNPGSNKTVKTYLIDPLARADVRLEVGPLDEVQEKHASPSDWLTSSLDEYKKQLKDFAITQAGVRPIKIGDQDAAVAEITFTDGKRSMKGTRITLYGTESAANLGYMAEGEDFDGLAKSFQQLVDSVRVK
ncbi:hypothetical protein Poly51_20990 [Rubripirellula tenax]|uniref:Uncharacterized protein n=1 Tax=Rubripirellula tenax TaxID=2528015 RepID=A0A5C6FI43_9BACT|nr:DUF3108 domain-containing protein [Rubripirellula tenax]TWU59311.1 hypothetical protein Poly51_20990 [Rubripirellula tenax]